MFDREYRELSFINRWSVARRLKDQSNAEHQFYVVLYADQIAERIGWTGDRAALMRWALLHDLDELLTGDMPGPGKRCLTNGINKPAVYAALEQRFPEKMWMPPDDDQIILIVKLANILDELFWISTDQQLGNASLDDVAVNTWVRFYMFINDMGFVLEHTRDALVSEIKEAVKMHRYAMSRTIGG